MKRIVKIIIPFALLTLSVTQASEASPKVTQAALCDFKMNEVTALAVEAFGKAPRLLFVSSGDKVVYSTTFVEGFNNDEFALTNPFLRFRSYKLKGLPSPLIIAVGVSSGVSDVGYEIKFIAEKNGAITTLTPESIFLSMQDGLYLGYINAKYGNGMIIWKFIWGNEAHFDFHRYEIQVYRWDTRRMNFHLVKRLETKTKSTDGCTALQSYQLPCKNFRDEIVPVEQEISTLGIEDKLLPEAEKNEKRP